jgi:hypothetical protein
VITVTSQSFYTILRTADPSKEDSRDKADKEKSAGTLDESDPDATSFDSGDSLSTTDETGKPSAPTTRPGDGSVARREGDQEVRKYELVYENGRWKLVTKLDEKTEKSIENAFNSALRVQI